ncbi:hypothetical protein D3C87_82060 [compost metagenome]
MSAIDCVWHEIIGQLDGIPIYRLLEDVEKTGAHDDFPGAVKGDILLGGGSGEAPATHIKIVPMLEYLKANWDDKNSAFYKYSPLDLITCLWDFNEGYRRIKRYIEIGYKINEDGPIETWLFEHIIAFLVKTYPEVYANPPLREGSIDQDGSVCGPPKKEHVEMADNWFKSLAERSPNRFKNADRITKEV